MMQTVDKAYACYLFDLDGTIYLGDELLPGSAELLAGLRERGRAVRFLSNNPTRDVDMYLQKLNSLGIEARREEVTNTVVTTRNWLLEHHPDGKLFVVGEEPLQRELRNAGFELTDDPEQIDIVVASYDRAFDYRKLQIAFDALWLHKRAILIQTNPDRYCPFPGGRGEPDCAAITAAIEACTEVQCAANLGKPSALMLETAVQGLGVDLADCIMVGDRLHTDIKMALDAGAASALVLTGDSTLSDVESIPTGERPTYVLERIDQLLV